MEDCIFCKIIKGEIPSCTLYEDETVLAFLDIGPVNPGHTLVIPKTHSRNAMHMSASDFSTFAEALPAIAQAVQKGTNADGINIIFNNESAAGQIVFHTHAHILPRFQDDGHIWWPHGSYAEDEMEAYAEKIRNEL